MRSTDMRDESLPDMRLLEALQTLKWVPPRDMETAARGRAQFLSQARELREESIGLPVFQAPIFRLQEWYRKTFAVRDTQPVRVKLAGAFLAIVILLIGTTAATAYAARGALPGDGLYAVKTGMEDIRLALTVDIAEDGVLQLDFAQRRVGEMQALIDNGRYKEVSIAAGKLERHLMQASKALQNIQEKDGAQAQTLEVYLKRFASQNEGVLTGLLAASPDASQTAIQGALQVTRELGGTQQDKDKGDEVEFEGTIESINGSRLVVDGITVVISDETEIKGAIGQGTVIKVEGVANEDGSVTAYEISLDQTEAVGEETIEPENDDGDANTNENESEDDESGGGENEQKDDANEAESENEDQESVEKEDEDPGDLKSEEEDENVNEDDAENSASESDEEGEKSEDDDSTDHDGSEDDHSNEDENSDDKEEEKDDLDKSDD